MRWMGLFVFLGSLIVACGLREHSSGWKFEEEVVKVVEVVVGWLWGVGYKIYKYFLGCRDCCLLTFRFLVGEVNDYGGNLVFPEPCLVIRFFLISFLLMVFAL